MSDFSIINLLDIDDPDAGKNGLTKHFSRKHIDSKDLGISLFKYAANTTSKAHKHKVQEEAYVVVRGSGQIYLNGEVKDLKVWDVVRVAPQTIRAFKAGSDGLDILAAGGPKPPDGDGELVEITWPS